MLVYAPFALCFIYTSWHFDAFSRTKLLTRCHSVSSLFSTVFVFQKSYTGNIFGIGRNKAQSSYFPSTRHGDQRRVGGDQEVATPPSGEGAPGRTTLWCGTPWCPQTSPLRLYKASDAKTLNQLAFFSEKFRSATAIEDQFRGTEVFVPAPCRDGELPLIRLQHIYNFWCSMLVFTPFAYCFVTLRDTFMHFLELTY
jgi:hypothetical protein